MAVDTPATIAILGAGPIGLEAALYARFMGYKVDIYERGKVAENVLAWGHVKMFSPFQMNRSTLGAAAIQAQDATWQAPDDTAMLTGREWAESYLLPLAATDLLSSHVHQRTRVVGVSREDLLKHERVGMPERGEPPFHLLLEDANGPRIAVADVVIDATGTFGNHNWFGSGGLPAVGEQAFASRIRYDLPDVLGCDKETYANRRTVVIGGGYSAATTIVALAELSRLEPQTHVSWLVRGDRSPQEPVLRIPNDSLAQRDRLAEESAAAIEIEAVDFHPGTSIDTLKSSTPSAAADDLVVTTRGMTETEIPCDQVIANVGYHGDRSIFEQLQVHECYASGAPMKLAATLAGQTSSDCLQQVSTGVDTLVTTEPDFYVLGGKSYGRDSRFLVSRGLDQIRELFGLIGGRATLNLYEDVQGLLSR